MSIEEELRELFREYTEAQEAFNNADPGFLDVVIAKLTYIELKIAALRKLLKEGDKS